MKETKEQKEAKELKNGASGITLIALVVTIIVLMIISGIAVATLMGENGIIKRAGDAKETQRGAAVQDEVTLAIAENAMIDQLNSVNGGNENKKKRADVVADLVKKEYLNKDEAKLLETEDTITIGSITIDFSKLEVESGGGPGGDNPAPGESGYAGGAYNDPYIPEGFTHTGSEDWNHGYTITGNAGTANAGDQFVWVPCSTEETPPTGVVKFQKTLPATTETTDPNYKYNQYNLALHPSGGTNASVNSEDASVVLIRNSVGRNGGFYIAKYEAGCPLDVSNNEIVPASRSTITDFTQKARSVSGANPWNYISRVNAITASSNMVTGSNVTSCLISGECWDTTLAWIADSSYATNSDGKGWYSDVSSSSKHTTGYYGTNTNNIFDLGGNMFEWTTENCKFSSDQYAVGRGGNYKNTGSYCPAAHRSYGSETNAKDRTGSFRVVLYK